jgi:hypothetical protein
MQWQDRLGFHCFLFFARPCGVETQAAGTAIGGVDSAQLGALMVAQSAAESAGAAFDAAGQPARYENFHFTVHMGASADFSIPITLKSVERNVTTGCARTLIIGALKFPFVRRPVDWENAWHTGEETHKRP